MATIEWRFEMKVVTRILVIIFFCVFSLTTHVSAQQIPSSAQSGIVARNLIIPPLVTETSQREAPLNLVKNSKPRLSMREDKKVVLRKFEFLGNTIFSSFFLRMLLVEYLDETVSFKDLQHATEIVEEYYKKRGYFLVRAILPAQDITEGVIKIQILEGQIGDLIIDGGKFYKKDFIEKHFIFSNTGRINYQALLKSLILLNEYSDLNVKLVLQKGKAPATTDIVLKVQDKRPLHFTVDYNNFGSRYVSRNSTGVGLEYSNVLVGGDKITAREVSGSPSRTLTYASVGYSLPINAYGTKVGASFEWSQYDVQREFRALDAGGRSQTVSVYLTHPLVRTLTSDADILVGFDAKDSRNYLLGSLDSVDKLRIFKIGLSGDRQDDSLSGKNYFNMILSKGVANTFGASEHNNPLASRQGAGGALLKGNIDISRYQQLPLDSVILLKAGMQVADRVLPASEQWAIGGEQTVRGFPESEYLGDYGSVVNVEWNTPLPVWKYSRVPFTKQNLKDFFHIVGFWDYGNAYLKNPQGGDLKHAEISGAGFGFRLNFGHNLNALIDFGYPVSGEKPSTGKHEVTNVQVIKRF